MESTKPRCGKGPLPIFYRDPVICFISLLNRPFNTRRPPPSGAASPYWTTCRASLPGEFFSPSTETVVKWTVCHFGRASIRLHKKDRVLQLCLPPPRPPSLPHWHSPPIPASLPSVEVPLQLAAIILSHVALSSPRTHTGELPPIRLGFSC